MTDATIDIDLELLSNETRLRIVAELAGHRFRGSGADGLSFSELFDAVDGEDSGNFNYHLKRLLGTVVEKTEDRYRLTYGGLQVFGWLHASTYAPAAESGPIPVGDPCPRCGDPVRGVYEEGKLEFGCERHQLIASFVPPAWLSALEPDALVRNVTLTLHHDLELLAHGICPCCRGSVTPRLRTDHEHYRVQFHYPCSACGLDGQLLPALPVLRAPRVARFYADNGIEVRRTPPWRLYETFESVTVRDESAPAVAVDLAVADARARVTVDGTSDPVAFERVSDGPG